MAKNGTSTYTPDYAIHPGEILEETLNSRGIKKTDFAARCGLTPKTVSLILAGKAPVSPENAINFESVLGISSIIWNNLNSNYYLFAARKKKQAQMQQKISWARKFPLNELKRRGFIPKNLCEADIVAKLLEFFGVGSADAWEDKYNKLVVAYRHSPSFKSSPYSLYSWLRIGEIRAASAECGAFDHSKFKSALSVIKNQTISSPDAFFPLMQRECIGAGVVLTVEPELPGTHLCGATFWINKDKALIMLSLRHKTNDHFWFSFFHEAGHILLHGKKMIFIEDQNAPKTDLEKEADHFATDFIIDSKEYREFVKGPQLDRQSIIAFAKSQSIAPGLVVGRLQHDNYIEYNKFNDLKISFRFAG